MKRKKSKSRKYDFVILGGLLLVAAALGLTLFNVWEDHRAAKSVETALEKIEELRAAAPTVDSGERQDVIAIDMTVEENAQATDPQQAEDVLADEAEMPAVQIDTYRYIGVLEIPAIGLKLPVMEEWSYANLALAPCRYLGSVYEDRFIITAHNYASLFGSLKNLAVGDGIQFTDMNWNTYHYVVSEIEDLKANEGVRLESGDWDLTLFTCTVGGQSRLTLRCDRTD